MRRAVACGGIRARRTACNTIVVIEVREARPLVSPAYDDGTATEADVIEIFRERFAALHRED